MKPSPVRWMKSWIVAASIGAASGLAAAGDVAEESVQSEIDSLRAEIGALRGRDGREVVEADRMAEIRALVGDVLADARDRTSFQYDDDIMGWQQGFRLASPDNSFSLEIAGQVQVRWVLNRANGADPTYLHGFENRRTRVDIRGHVVDPGWTYRVRTNYLFLDGSANVDECWVARSLGSGWSLKVGQFKTPWLREQLVPDSRLLAVERSVVSLYFDQLRSQGIELSWQGESNRLAFWTGDGVPAPGFGAAAANGFNTPWNETNVFYSLAARAEHRLAGDWDQFADLNSARGSEFGAMVGVAGLVQRARQSSLGVENAMAAGVTADLTLCFSGASLFVSGVWLNETLPDGPTTNPWGVTVQGGVYLLDELEVFGRYDYMEYDPTNVPPSETGRYNGPTVGANWFFNPAVKVTVDWAINFASLPSGAAVRTVAGMRSDEPGESGQWSLRAQIQLLF